MRDIDSKVILRKVLSTFDFTNHQQVMFEGKSVPIDEQLDDRKEFCYVVVMNHLDKKFFIARTRKLKVYLRNIAGFMINSQISYLPVELRQMATGENSIYWSVEVLDPHHVSINTIRQYLDGWYEMGSTTHISRLSNSDTIIFKITHKRTGWCRYSSYQAHREPIPDYIATQALLGIRSKVRFNRNIACAARELLEKEYSAIIREIKNDANSISIEIVKTIDKANEHERGIDIVRALNMQTQTQWITGDFINKLLQGK